MRVLRGNIFASTCECLVNTVNCDGFMGKGIALEMSIRYPGIEEPYKRFCADGSIDIGKLWIYNPKDGSQCVLNFPTKRHFRNPSKTEYLEAGLAKFRATYREKGITSIAFPLLGAQNGGLDASQSLDVMGSYLDDLDDVTIEVYQYDRDAYVRDPLFEEFVSYLGSHQDQGRNRLILERVMSDDSILGFADIASTKVQTLREDGSTRSASLATKAYLQRLVTEMKGESAQGSIF